MANEEAKTRVKGFDGVRGLGAIAVVFHHTWITDLNLGEVGVDLFFVLSGFLICGILHASRERIETRKSTWRTELFRFWINRGLRILPLYYSVVVLAAIIGIALGAFKDLLHNFIWFVLYLQNFLMAYVLKEFGSMAHTWTLAVEQQFYLLFGILMLLVPARRHLTLLFLALVAAFIGAWWTRAVGVPGVYVLPFYSFIPIVCGGITSVAIARKNITLSENSNAAAGLICCVALAGLALVPSRQTLISHFYVLSIIAVSFFGGLLYLEITRNQRSFVTRVLDGPVLRWLGGLSYGIYLIHGVALQVALHFGMSASFQMFAVVMTATLALAQASRHLIEVPALKLKWKRPIPSFMESTQTAA